MEILRPARIAAGLLSAWTLLAAGCGGSALSWDRPTTYIVQRGDTLYSISWRNRLDWQDVARWNNLGKAALIYPGQQLRLTPPPATSAARSSNTTPSKTGTRSKPASTPSKPAPVRRSTPPAPVKAVGKWQWPVKGPVLSGFGDKNAMGKGLDIGGKLGDPVRAAAGGKVVYAGSGLIGYGRLIIIKHNDTFLSAYGHNRKLLVREGEEVKAGQKIAEIGEGPGKKPLLHFEIRLNGKPVDPARYLPRR